MAMPSRNREPLEELAEEFAERYRRGERPSLTEYTRAHPELAAEIRELFPALLMMEELGSVDTSPSDPALAGKREPVPKQLGEYHLLQEVGRGGMGVVYEAVQESLGRHVALKVLPQQHWLRPSQLERFRREARAAAGLHHTNIVPVFGVGEQDGVHFYAMQFIQGQGLDLVIRELRRMRAKVWPSTTAPTPHDSSAANRSLAVSIAQGLVTGQFPARSERRPDAPQVETVSAAHPLSHQAEAAKGRSGPLSRQGEETGSTAQNVAQSAATSIPSLSELIGGVEARYFWSVARLGKQTADALDYAHRQGVLHRDIKPSNLLLDTSGTVWVTDFGLAKAEGTEEITSPGDIVGTLRYMAPERFGGKSDARSDIYSLGVTLYELLTLRPAFRASDQAQLIEQIAHVNPDRPQHLDPRVPRDLETIVLKAMTKEPAERYATAAELAEDLGRFLADRPIHARRTRLPERLLRWCRRNPREAGLLGLVAALLLVVTVGATIAALWLDHERETAVANQVRAEGAEEEAGELWKSFLAQLQTSRQGPQAGHRFKSLDLLAKVAAQRPSLELRNEAIWFLTQADLRVVKEWHGLPPGSRGAAVDGKLERYARAEENGNIGVRRIDDDTQIMSLPGFGVWAAALAFSPDGCFLAVKYHRDRELHFCVWDLEGQRLIVNTRNGVEELAFNFSPDSRSVAAGQWDRSVCFYDLASGEETNRWPADASRFVPYHLAYRPDGRQLAVSSHTAPEVRIRDLDTGEVVRTLAHPKVVRGVAWHPDGKYLATACDNWHIYVWDVGTGRQISDLTGHRGPPIWLAFSRQGDLLASSSWDGTTRVWEPWTGKLLVSAPGGYSVQFSLDDRLLATGRDGPRVWLWEVAAARERRVLHGHHSPEAVGVADARISPDGRLLASIGGDGIRLWDLHNWKEVALIGQAGSSVIFHPSGQFLIATGNSGIQVWPIEWKSPPADRDIRVGPPRTIPLAGVRRLRHADLSQDGRSLIVEVDPGQALVFDIEHGKPKHTGFRHTNLGSVAMSPDGKCVATGTWQSTGVKVWDADAGKLIKDLPVDGTANVTFSPDGRWLVTCTGQEYRFWDTGAWQPGLQIPREGAGNIPGCIVFSADSTMLAITRSRTLVRLIDPTTGRELVTLPTSGGALCFSPDGSLLVTGGENHTLHVWDLRLIRQQLAATNLDWDLPPYPPAEPLKTKSPFTIKVLTTAEDAKN